jgi:hypothetical protein
MIRRKECRSGAGGDSISSPHGLRHTRAFITQAFCKAVGAFVAGRPWSESYDPPLPGLDSLRAARQAGREGVVLMKSAAIAKERLLAVTKYAGKDGYWRYILPIFHELRTGYAGVFMVMWPPQKRRYRWVWLKE